MNETAPLRLFEEVSSGGSSCSSSSSSSSDDIGGSASCDTSSVQVAVRVRPLLGREADDATCIEVSSNHDNDPSDIDGSRRSSLSSHHPSVIRIGHGKTSDTYTFDDVFPISATQREVFERRVKPLVMSCLEGYNATILAYGQTGSGKTFTIMGPQLQSSSSATTTASGAAASAAATERIQEDEEDSLGVIPRALNLVFAELKNMAEKTAATATAETATVDTATSDSAENNNDNIDESSVATTEGASFTPETQQQQQNDGNKANDWVLEYEVRVQFLELYGEDLRDLLKPPSSPPSPSVVQQQEGGADANKLVIRNSTACPNEPEVIGAIQTKVENAAEALSCLERGMLQRVTGATAMNETSSRSHAIFSVLVDQQIVPSSSSSPSAPTPTTTNKKRSKFHFVDLAGSERIKRTLAEGQRLKEGIDINKGLLVLGNVISALGDPRKRSSNGFVPYRESKLTRLLQGSLGGNHKTLMIACVSPSAGSIEESRSCLRYANRAKNIENHAVINVDPSSRVIAELRTRVRALSSDLLLFHRQQQQGSSTGGGRVDTNKLAFTKEQIEAMANDATAVPENISSLLGNTQKESTTKAEKAKDGGYCTATTTRDNNTRGNTHDATTEHPRTLVPSGQEDDADSDGDHLQSIANQLSVSCGVVYDDEKKEEDSSAEETKKLFREWAARYEKQISELKEQLNETRSELAAERSRNDRWSSRNKNLDNKRISGDGVASPREEEEEESDGSGEKEKEIISESKEQLNETRSEPAAERSRNNNPLDSNKRISEDGVATMGPRKEEHSAAERSRNNNPLDNERTSEDGVGPREEEGFGENDEQIISEPKERLNETRSGLANNNHLDNERISEDDDAIMGPPKEESGKNESSEDGSSSGRGSLLPGDGEYYYLYITRF